MFYMKGCIVRIIITLCKFIYEFIYFWISAVPFSLFLISFKGIMSKGNINQQIMLDIVLITLLVSRLVFYSSN